MRIRTIFFTTALILFEVPTLFAQISDTVSLSLKECIDQSVEKNINMVKARIEQEKSAYQVAQTRSALLPQIEVGGSFLNNIKLPTTMLPGVFIGQPGTTIPVQIGSRYNASAAITVNQVLYNQTVLTSLKISKQKEELSRLGVKKAGEDLALEIAKLYFLAQTTAEQKMLLKDNIARTQRMATIAKIVLDNGMGKQVDYDRIQVALQNLHTQLDNTEALHEQQLNMIKYMLEIPVWENILLTDTADMPLLHVEPLPVSDFSSHIDMRILESQQEIARLNHINIHNDHIPTLSFLGQFSYQGLRSEFNDYFNNSPENNWRNSSYIGINLSIPIFDGFNKRSKSRQAKLEYTQSQLVLNNTNERFDVEYKNAVNNYYNSRKNVERQQQNIELAEKVYSETALKYREGLSSMSDLLQDAMGLNNAQAGYLNALYNFKDAELQIMSLNGEMRKIINQ